MSDDDRGRTLQQQFLEPLDALDVEMVGGFIEQQQFGLHGQSKCQGCAFALTSGAGRWSAFAVEIETV